MDAKENIKTVKGGGVGSASTKRLSYSNGKG